MSAAEASLAGSAGVVGGRRDLGYLWLRGRQRHRLALSMASVPCPKLKVATYRRYLQELRWMVTPNETDDTIPEWQSVARLKHWK
jgi:hypothetical protein